MQEPATAACPPSPSRLLKNAVQPLSVRNRDIHTHSTFSSLSPSASPARGVTPEADEPLVAPSAPASQQQQPQQQQQQLQQQQQQLSSSQRVVTHSGGCGAASQLLATIPHGPAALRSSSFATGMTGATAGPGAPAVSSMIPTPSGAPGADATAPPPAKRVWSAALELGAAAAVQRKHAATAAATCKAGTAAAGGSKGACMPPADVQQQRPAAVTAAVGIKPEVVELSEDEEEEDRSAAAAAAETHAAAAATAQAEAAAVAQAAAAAAAAAADANDGYDEAALRSDGAGRINLTSKSRQTYGNSNNQQDTRMMIVRRLRAMLAAAGAGKVYDDINTNCGLSKRGLKWMKTHLDDFFKRVLGPKGMPGSAPWPTPEELKPYLELRYLARFLSWLTGRRVTVPQVNACFLDGAADWVAMEAHVTALLGVPAAQLQLPLRPLQLPLRRLQLPLRLLQQQQPLMQAPLQLLLRQQQPAASALHSSHMSGGTGFAQVHGTAGAAAAALTHAHAGPKWRTYAGETHNGASTAHVAQALI